MEKTEPSLGGWVAEAGGIRHSMLYRRSTGFDSIRLYPEQSGTLCEFYLDSVLTLQQTEKYLFHAYMMVVGPGLGLTTATVTLESPTTGISVSQITNIGRSEKGDNWFVVRSRLLDLPPDGNSYPVKVSISLNVDSETEVFFTRPTLIPYFHFAENLFLRRVYDFIPDFLIDLDVDSSDDGDLPDMQMTRFMDIALKTHNEVEQDFTAISYVDFEDGRVPGRLSTYSELVDYEVMRKRFTKWIAAVTGNNLLSPGIVATPWGNLPNTWTGIMQELDDGPNPSVAITDLERINITVTPSALERSNGTVTATVSSTEYLTVNDVIIVEGAESAEGSLDGVFRISAITSTTISWADEGSNEIATAEGTITPRLGLVTATVSSAAAFSAGDYITVQGSVSAGTSFDGNFRVFEKTSTTVSWKQQGPTESASTTGTLTLLDTEWIEVMGFDPDVIDLLDYQRWVLGTQVFGTLSGTRIGLETALEKNLVNQKRHRIIYNYNDNPWEVRIETATEDTDFGEEGLSNTKLLGALELCRPCGFLFTHECVSAEFFEE
jgi:hypothetical protein